MFLLVWLYLRTTLELEVASETGNSFLSSRIHRI